MLQTKKFSNYEDSNADIKTQTQSHHNGSDEDEFENKSNLTVDNELYKNAMEETINFNHPVLNQLCDPKKFKEDTSCYICKKEFGMFRPRNNCKFCGNSICASCSPKKRGNPQRDDEFVEICNKCELIYLKKMLFDEYRTKVIDLEKKLAQRLDDLQSQEAHMKKLLHDFEAVRANSNQQNKELEDGLRKLKEKNQKVKNEIERLEKENTKHNELIRDHEQETATIKKKLEENRAILEDKKTYLEELKADIIVREKDVRNLKQEILMLEGQLEIMNQSLVSDRPSEMKSSFGWNYSPVHKNGEHKASPTGRPNPVPIPEAPNSKQNQKLVEGTKSCEVGCQVF